MGKWYDEALRMKPYILKGAQLLKDIDALKIATIYEEWCEGREYPQGEKILYNNILYKCLGTHTSQSTWEPINTTSLWSKVLIPDENKIYPWEQPNGTNPYNKGDKVSYDGKIWVSDCDYNVWVPGVYGWTEIT